MKNEFIKLNYEIKSGDFINGGEASSCVKKALMQLGIKSSIIKRVCVACYEAEMNVVIHTLGGNMEVIIYNNKVEITIKDKGPGIGNIDLAMTEGYSTAPDEAREMGFGGGMGLPNIKKSSDEFYINSVLGKYTLVKIIIDY